MPSRYARRSFAILAALATALATPLAAQELSFPSDPLAETAVPDTASATDAPGSTMAPGAAQPMGADVGMTYAPLSTQGSGMVYNPTLGAHLRARFNTRSYGQQQDTLDLGTMKLMNLDGGVAFLDGQVTMNDDSRVGYNLGVGYRWLTLPMFPWSPDDEKIMGVSLWSDGQTTGGDNFFSQVGVGLEFLGERIDFRANGYAPVGPRSRTRDFGPTEEFTFTGNSVGQLLQGVKDTALTVGEAEVAGRLGDLDAWAFAGVYGLNGGAVDTVGGKLGLRGYATPDLLLSIAIANDDEFDTNALFSATWFIGRTRAENCPTGTLRDRFREPVIRNDYIATQQSVAFAAGPAAVDADGDAIRIVHVDSSAAPGGDGSFEAPLNSLDDIQPNSQDDDLVLAHGGSDFNSQNAVLRDGQTFFGEGDGMNLQITTNQFGMIDLPETAPGAAAGPRPTIDGGAGAAVRLADNNIVQNFSFDGGVNAVVTDAVNGSFNPTLSDISVTGVTGDAFLLNTVVRADVDDIDDDNNTSETINVLGAVTIDEIAFNNVGGADIRIDAEADSADVNSGESIAISNVTSTGNQSADASIAIANTNGTTGDAVTIADYDYTGGLGGGLLLTETDGPVTVTESTFTGGTGPAVEVQMSAGTVNVGATNTITDVAGNAIVVNANTAAVAIDADVNTDGSVNGGGVLITANEAMVSVGGDLESNNVDGVTVRNAKGAVDLGSASGGDIQDGTITHTGTGDAIVIEDNGADAETADTSVAITVTADVINSGGRSVVVTGGNDNILFAGELTDTGEGVRVSGLEADATVGFGPTTTLTTTTNDAVVLSGNDADSSVTFQELDITTTTGRGLVSDGGELNVTDTDGATDPTFGSSITTDTGKAIDITGGSSTQGVAFGDVTTTGTVVGDEAVEVANFEGTVTIDGGTLNSTVAAARFENAEFEVDGVTLNGGGADAMRAVFSDDINRIVSVTDVDAGGGNVTFQSTGASSGNTTATVTDLTDGGLARYDSAGSGANSLTITDAAFVTGYTYTTADTSSLDVTMNTDDDTLTGGQVTYNSASSGANSLAVNDLTSTAGFNYNASGTGSLDVDMTDVTGSGITGFVTTSTGDSTLDITDTDTGGLFDYQVNGEGDLDVTMTTVTGVGDTTLAVNDGGNGSLSMNSVNTGGVINATGAGGATGDLVVSTGNSGNTTAFTGVTVNQQGTGSALATFNSTTSTSGVDFDSASDSVSTLSISGGDYDGAIDFDETGDGSATMTLTNVTATTGGVTFDSSGAGTATATVSGGTYAGDIDLEADNTAAFSASLSGNIDLAGADFIVNADNTGTFNASVNRTTAAGGSLLVDAANSVTNATITLTGGGFEDGVTVNANNTGTIDYTMNGMTFDTADNLAAVDLNFGAGITSGGVDIQNNNITTVDGGAFDARFAGGTVAFRLNNNAFTNQAGAVQTAFVGASGTSTLNATVTGNTFTNLDAGATEVEFEIATLAGSPRINLNLSSNTAVNGGGGAGSGELLVREGAGTFAVFELDDTFNNTGARNDATVTFDPNNQGDFTDLANPPATP